MYFSFYFKLAVLACKMKIHETVLCVIEFQTCSNTHRYHIFDVKKIYIYTHTHIPILTRGV